MKQVTRVCRIFLLVSGVFLTGAWVRSFLLSDMTITIDTVPVATLTAHEHIIGDSPDDPGHHVVARSTTHIAPRDLWITGIDESIEHAPSTLLHHLVLIQSNKPNLSCPAHMGRELIVSGQDSMYSPHLRLPPGYALFIKKGTPLQLIGMLHNPEPPRGPGGTYSGVVVRTTLHVVPAVDGTTFTPVELRVLYLDEHGCADAVPSDTFTIPPKSLQYHYSGTHARPDEPAQMIVMATSTIVYVGAHLHGWQGGKELIVLRNGKPFADLKTQRVPGDPYLFQTPHFATSTQVLPGETISIESTYDNPYSVPVRGAMAFFAMYMTAK